MATVAVTVDFAEESTIAADFTITDNNYTGSGQSTWTVEVQPDDSPVSCPKSL